MNTNSLPQRGFIQGAIIFALALIAVIIAVLSSGTSDNADQLSREQAKQQAGQIISGGAKIYSGYLRAQADGLNPFQVSGGGTALSNLVIPQPALATVASQAWDLRKYSGFPKIDDVAFAGNAALPFLIQDIGEVLVTGIATSISNSGCGAAVPCTLLVTLDGLKKSVCDAINFKMNKIPGRTLESMDPIVASGTSSPGRTITELGQVNVNFEPGAGNIEGCFKVGAGSNNHMYFKALHVNWKL